MATLKKVYKISSNIIIGVLILYGLTYTLMIKTAPATADRLFPYRAYTVVTDSMVPTIPVGSLVISKRVKPDQVLQPGTIITFEALRFGDQITLTHYLREITEENGKLRYRTQAEGVTNLDDYKTYREDILGTYVYHVPYIGKAAQFLNSTYGLIMMIGLLLIWMVNFFIKYQAKNKKGESVSLEHVHFYPDIMECSLRGKLYNQTQHTLRLITLHITLYNIYNEPIGTYEFDPLGGKALKPGAKVVWKFHQADTPNVAAYQINSQNMTLDYPDIFITPPKK